MPGRRQAVPAILQRFISAVDDPLSDVVSFNRKTAIGSGLVALTALVLPGQVRPREVNHMSRFLALATVTAASLAFIASAASAAPPPTRRVASYLTPVTVSSECRSDTARRAACDVVTRFFHELNSGRFASACAVLGERLRDDNRGLGCPRFLSAGYPERMPWGIVRAQHAGSGVAVLVTLGQSELGHIRMRRHRAYVDVEGGRLQILETRLVR
jgi:hypothetical protein